MTKYGTSWYRNRRILSGISVGALGRILGLAAPFVTMPWLVDYLGPRVFGIWITATGLTTISAFLDLGLGNALLTRLASAFGRDAIEEARDAISSAYAALGMVALGLLMLGAGLFALAGPVLLHFDIAPMPSDAAIIGTTLFGFIIGIPISIIYRIYYARQQVAVANYWQILGAAISVLVTYLAIRMEAQAWQVTLLYALAPVAAMLAASAWLYLRHPALRPRVAGVSMPLIGDLLSLGMRFLALAVLTSVFLNLDPIVVAWKAGPEAVTNFAVPAKLGSLLLLLVTTLFLPLWAANGDAIARGDYLWLRRSTCRMSLYGSLLVAVLGVGLVWAGDWLIWLWMHDAYDQQTGVLAAFALFATIMALTSPHMMVLNAMGKVGPQIAAFALFGAVSVPLKLWLVDFDQIWGAPVISAVTYSTMVLPIIFLSASKAGAER